jgi:hypothetical protein
MIWGWICQQGVTEPDYAWKCSNLNHHRIFYFDWNPEAQKLNLIRRDKWFK